MKKILLITLVLALSSCSKNKSADPGTGSGGFITGNGFRNISNARAFAVATSSLTSKTGNLIMIDKDGNTVDLGITEQVKNIGSLTNRICVQFENNENYIISNSGERFFIGKSTSLACLGENSQGDVYLVGNKILRKSNSKIETLFQTQKEIIWIKFSGDYQIISLSNDNPDSSLPSFFTTKILNTITGQIAELISEDFCQVGSNKYILNKLDFMTFQNNSLTKLSKITTLSDRIDESIVFSDHTIFTGYKWNEPNYYFYNIDTNGKLTLLTTIDNSNQKLAVRLDQTLNNSNYLFNYRNYIILKFIDEVRIINYENNKTSSFGKGLNIYYITQSQNLIMYASDDRQGNPINKIINLDNGEEKSINYKGKILQLVDFKKGE